MTQSVIFPHPDVGIKWGIRGVLGAVKINTPPAMRRRNTGRRSQYPHSEKPIRLGISRRTEGA